MSWLSKKFKKGVNFIAKASPLDKVVGKDREREAIGTAIGGPQGGMNEYSKNKGMSESEAARNSYFLGATYSSERNDMRMRIAKEKIEASDAEFARQQAEQQVADRNAQGVLIRRRRARADPSKGGTLLTGSLGLSGSNAGTKLGVV